MNIQWNTVLSRSVMSDSVMPWTIACQAPTSMRILQARMLEWVAMPSSRGSSQPRDPTQSPALHEDSLLSQPPGKPKNTNPFCTHILSTVGPRSSSGPDTARPSS